MFGKRAYAQLPDKLGFLSFCSYSSFSKSVYGCLLPQVAYPQTGRGIMDKLLHKLFNNLYQTEH
jgi:hypothetical protein